MVLALAGLSVLVPAQAQTSTAPRVVPKALNTVPPQWQTDRIIVRYKNADPASAPTATQLDRARVAGNRQGVQLSHVRRTGLGADVLRLSRFLPLDRVRVLARELQNGDAGIDYAEPDRLLFPTMTPTDAYFSAQWDLFDPVGGINAPTAWDKSTGAGVVVAVVDTGVRPHADLAANLLSGYDFIVDTNVSNDGNGRDSDASDPGDGVAAGFCASGSAAQNSTWHGTHVAGTIAAVANNGIGVAGIAYGAKILPVRAVGRCGGYTSDVVDGMVWAAGGSVSRVPANTKPAKVINISLGGVGACDSTMQNGINAVRARGAVVVVAAGNENADAAQSSPASCTGVITVAAIGRNGGKASYSNYGSVVSIAAPGGDGGDGILSTVDTGLTSPVSDGYASYMGTSMATPHISGVAAMMLSKNPSLTPDELAARLKASARPFPATCSSCGAGIVDAASAVGFAAGVPVITEVEPNNGLSTAQAITSLPIQISGAANGSPDADLFKVTVPAGKTLTATMTPSSTSNFDLYLYNASVSLLASSKNGVGLVDTVSATNSAGSDTIMYVRVLYTGGTNATYSLLLK